MWTKDQIADACAEVEIADSDCEALLLALPARPDTPVLDRAPSLPTADQQAAGSVEAERALRVIADWQLPVTGKFWPSGNPVSYEAEHGSNGAREYMRGIARAALDSRAKPVAAGGELPTEISAQLREFASNPGYSHNDYADVMRRAADECDRYYGGMMAWKKTAEKKDADWNAERMERSNDRCAARAALPKWIDDAKGKDPFTDDLIEHIIKLMAGQQCADSRPAGGVTDRAYWNQVLSDVADCLEKHESMGLISQFTAFCEQWDKPAATLAASVAPAAPDELRRIGQLLLTQDEECTADAMFVVEQERTITGIDTDFDPDIAWVIEDSVIVKGDDEFDELEAAYEADGTVPDDYTRTGYMKNWDFVTAFLTREAAEAFVAKHAHKYDGPLRFTVECEHRNIEWRLVRESLMALAATKGGA